MNAFSPAWHKTVHEARMRRHAKEQLQPKPVLQPIVHASPPCQEHATPAPIVPSVAVLYRRMTLAYHAEATAKTEEERAAARFEREHVNHLLMEAAR